MNQQKLAIAIIERLGGTTATAELCEVSPSAVSQWKGEEGIPKRQLKFLRLARPDVFDFEASPALPHTNPDGAKAREAKAKAMVGRMKIDPKNLAQ
jgi:hypothetical protein